MDNNSEEHRKLFDKVDDITARQADIAIDIAVTKNTLLKLEPLITLVTAHERKINELTGAVRFSKWIIAVFTGITAALVKKTWY